MGDFDFNTFLKYATIPACGILIPLMFLQKRARPNPCGLLVPGLVAPMRFLEEYENRWAYALSFGTMASMFLSIVLNNLNPWSPDFFCEDCKGVPYSAFSLQGEVLVATLVSAPHFVCITTPYKMVGAILGFAYSAFRIVFGFLRIAEIEDGVPLSSTYRALLYLKELPLCACLVGLCVCSARVAYTCYTTKRFRDQSTHSLVEPHQVDHVTSLFHPLSPEEPAPEGRLQKLKWKVRAEQFQRCKLPTRVVSIAVVQCIFVYYVAVALIFVRQMVGSFRRNSTEKGSTLFGIFDAVYALTAIVSLGSALLYAALFVINYRIHMIKIYKGKKHNFVSSNDISPEHHVASSLRLPGYQIAYTFWGFFTMFTGPFIFFAIVGFGGYFVLTSGRIGSILEVVLKVLSAPAITLIAYFLQELMAKFFLLQPKLDPEDKHRPLNIDNRRVYEVTGFVLLFSNVLVGIFSVLLRWLKLVLMGLFFLPRLDRPVFRKSSESRDNGYMAYVSALLVDNAHNNPAMRTFCALLVSLTSASDSEEDRGIACLPTPGKNSSNSKAVRRWHLAYTLMKNPDLGQQRKQALQAGRSDDEDACTSDSLLANSGHDLVEVVGM